MLFDYIYSITLIKLCYFNSKEC